jgi:hypothetical protein
VLVMFSLEVDKIMRTLLTLGENSSTPRRHGSRQNNESITNTRCNSRTPRRHGSGHFVHFHVFLECSSWSLVLVLFSLFCALPCLRGVLEFAPRVSNVLIILSTPMSSWRACQLEHSTKRWKWTNNENITNTTGKLEHSTKTWKWTK